MPSLLLFRNEEYHSLPALNSNPKSISSNTITFNLNEKVFFAGRAENILIEQKLNGIRSDYENTLEKIKEELKMLQKDVCNLQKQIENMQLDEDIIDNFGKYYPKDEIKKLSRRQSKENFDKFTFDSILQVY